MGIESALYDHLLTDATITGLVSTRIYPGVAPGDVAQPHITFHVVSGEHDQHLGGGGGLVAVGMQIDVSSATSSVRRSVVDALFSRLHGYTGAMGTEALAVRSVTFDGPVNSYQKPTAGEEAGIHRARVEARIYHVESVPTF